MSDPLRTILAMEPNDDVIFGERYETLAPKSDTLIRMPEISATEASRRFSDLLDGVEHRGETYTIVRRGRVVAKLEPAAAFTGADLKATAPGSSAGPPVNGSDAVFVAVAAAVWLHQGCPSDLPTRGVL